MGQPIYDLDEGLWELYITDCQMKELMPSIKDYLVWCDEEDYDRPEVWDGNRESFADLQAGVDEDRYQQEQTDIA